MGYWCQPVKPALQCSGSDVTQVRCAITHIYQDALCHTCWAACGTCSRAAACRYMLGLHCTLPVIDTGAGCSTVCISVLDVASWQVLPVELLMHLAAHSVCMCMCILPVLVGATMEAWSTHLSQCSPGWSLQHV
jgi:hypothetical protein